MVANNQLSFLNIVEYRQNKTVDTYFELCLILKLIARRVHYDIPFYKKIYSVYRYDQDKYMDIFRRIHDLAEKYDPLIFKRVNPYKVLRLCYLPDEAGLVPLGDEQHIFRVRVLQRIYSRIFDYCGINPMERELKVYTQGLVCHIEDRQAEIQGTEMLPLKLRLKIHIQLLRLLKQGIELREAVKECQMMMPQK